MNNDLTLPGSIPGLLRRGSPVTHIDGSRLVVVEIDGDNAKLPSGWVLPSGWAFTRLLALDLTDATGRAHAAWWLWLDENAAIPRDRLPEACLSVISADAVGMNWCEMCWVLGVGTRGEILGAVRLARDGQPMTAEQIATLRLVVLHAAGLGVTP
jgi:hypothetical protein